MRRILPPCADASAQDVDDEALLTGYAPEPGTGAFVRFNFVSSLDGAATHQGRSGALGTAADHRVFMLLRRLADVILVGAGTVRAEGYEGELLDDASRAWRLAHGMSERPILAVASGHLDLDEHGALFSQNPGEILLLTSAAAPAQRIAALAPVAEIITAEGGGAGLDPHWIIKTLHDRGMRLIHAEGGPTLFGDFLRADAISSLALTYSPLLVAGNGPRIAGGAHLEVPVSMELRLLHEQDGTLLADYRRG